MTWRDLDPRPALARLPREHASTRVAGAFRIFACAAAISRVSNTVVTSRWAEHDGGLALWCALFVAFAWPTFLGLWTRVSSTGLAVTAAVLWLYYGQIEGTIKEYFPFQLAILIAFVPAGRSFSLDRLRAVRRARARGLDPPPERGPRWGLELVVWAPFVIYAFAALDKATAEALSGGSLQRIWMALGGGSDDFALYPWLLHLSVVLAWVVLITEVALAAALLHRGVRHRIAPYAMAFHLGLWFFINPWQFTLGMCAWWVAALDPARFHAAIDRLLGHTARDS